MKKLAITAVLMLVTATAAACGTDEAADDAGPGAAPDNASTEEFCGSYADLFSESLKSGDQVSDEDAVRAMKDFAEEMEQIGTPENISAEARRGFELAIQAIKDLPADAEAADIEDLEKSFDEAETKASEAFSTYMGKECADVLQEKLKDQVGELEDQLSK